MKNKFIDFVGWTLVRPWAEISAEGTGFHGAEIYGLGRNDPEGELVKLITTTPDLKGSSVFTRKSLVK